jgi:hypothetical protein
VRPKVCDRRSMSARSAFDSLKDSQIHLSSRFEIESLIRVTKGKEVQNFIRVNLSEAVPASVFVNKACRVYWAAVTVHAINVFKAPVSMDLIIIGSAIIVYTLAACFVQGVIVMTAFPCARRRGESKRTDKSQQCLSHHFLLLCRALLGLAAHAVAFSN